MSDYINRDEVNAVLQNIRTKYALLAMSGAEHIIAKAQDLIDELPAADVRENIRAEWKTVREYYPRYCCSACNHLYNNKGYKFCPFCGANMRMAADEG